MNQVRKIVIAAVCLALCLILPFLTGNNRELGTLFSLMHLPVLLCGIICGLEYGLLVGFTAPLLRSVMFGMPPMPIVAVPMAFELAAYGLVAGFLYRRLPRGKSSIFVSLIVAMIIGRFVNLAASFLFGTPAILSSLYGLFVGTLPGIIVQLILVPASVTALRRAGLADV